MKNFSIFSAVVIVLLASCELTNYAPPVTSKMATIGARQSATGRTRGGEHVRHGTNPSDWRIDLATLHEGRRLFVSRCIECHTLPAVSQHSAAEWPRLIDEMAGRASLKPADRIAVLAYILAAREQR